MPPITDQTPHETFSYADNYYPKDTHIFHTDSENNPIDPKTQAKIFPDDFCVRLKDCSHIFHLQSFLDMKSNNEPCPMHDNFIEKEVKEITSLKEEKETLNNTKKDKSKRCYDVAYVCIVVGSAIALGTFIGWADPQIAQKITANLYG